MNKICVCLLGKISDVSLLSGVYSAANLFFFPSTYDNASIAVREACTMKTPCLLTINSSVAEPFTDGYNGYLAHDTIEDMKNKILDIFNKKELGKIGECASKTIPISFETMAENTYAQYEKAISNYNKKHKRK